MHYNITKKVLETDLTTQMSHCFVVCLARTLNPVVLYQSSTYYTNVHSIGIMMLRCFVCLARTLNPVLHPSNMYY